MAKVKPLGKSATATPTASRREIPAPQAKQPDPPQDTPRPAALIPSKQEQTALAKQAGAIKLPVWLTQTNNMPAVAAAEFGGYVGFASSQSGKWNEQQGAGLSDGQPYLFHEQRYIPLPSLNFFLLAGESFQSLMVGKEGKFLWASRDLEEEGPRSGSNYPEPHYVCCLIVHAEDRLIPIKADFRGTKSGGIEGAIRAVEAAATPEWLALSDNHKISGAFPQPFGRVFHKCTTQFKVSKSSGNPYYKANCLSSPSTLSQMQMLVDAMGDDDFVKQLADCKKNYDGRITFMEQVIAKNPPAA